jgi:hypothetical protein
MQVVRAPSISKPVAGFGRMYPSTLLTVNAFMALEKISASV